MVLPLAGAIAFAARAGVKAGLSASGDQHQAVEVEILLGRDIVERLKRMKKDMRQRAREPVHQKVGKTIVDDATRNLRQRKDADGKGLEPWRPRTIELRQERGVPGRKILIAWGRMIRNMRNDFKIMDRGTTTETVVMARGKRQQDKSKWHQFGSRNVIFGVNNPARPYMGMKTSRQQAILRLFTIFFNHALERHSN